MTVEPVDAEQPVVNVDPGRKAAVRTSITLTVVGFSGTLLFTPLLAGTSDPGTLGAFSVLAFLSPFVLGIGLAAWIGTAVAGMAERRGRSWWLFFWLTVLVNPIIMLIVVAVLSPTGGPQATQVASPAPVQPTQDPADQLAKLGALLHDGILTQEEFDQKKKEILGRL